MLRGVCDGLVLLVVLSVGGGSSAAPAGVQGFAETIKKQGRGGSCSRSVGCLKFDFKTYATFVSVDGVHICKGFSSVCRRRFFDAVVFFVYSVIASVLLGAPDNYRSFNVRFVHYVFDCHCITLLSLVSV